MNKWIYWRLILVCCCTWIAGVAAAAETGPTDVKATIKRTLAERFPEVKIDEINASPVAGLYEILVGDEIAYVTGDGAVLISGKMMDTKTREDLTQKRLDKLHAISFDQLPLDLAIKTVKGNGKRKLAVFADPHCPYCAKLETEMKTLNDVTVYTFLYPLETIHPGAKQTAQKIWCSADRSTAWADAMLNHKEPTAKACSNDTIDKTVALGDKLHVNSTPTLFFIDGHRVAGAIPRDQLEAQLAKLDK